MVKSLKIFFWLNVSLLVFASCSITKRRYMDGYHIEWSGNHHEAKINELAKQEIQEVEEQEVTNEQHDVEFIGVDSCKNEQVTIAVENKSIPSTKQRIELRSNWKPRISESKAVKALAKTVINPLDSHAYKADGGMTGIKWLDYTIGVVLFVALIAFWLYTKPNYRAELSAGWAAFTANIWISILYILLFLLVVALLWAALDAMFGAVFPSNYKG